VLVYVTLFLLLYKHNISPYYALGIVYTLSEFYSLLIVKFFVSISRLFRLILVLGYIRLKLLKELERAYLDTLVV